MLAVYAAANIERCPLLADRLGANRFRDKRRVLAAAYLCKPIGFEMFDKLVKEINSYWLINGATTTLARAETPE